MTKPCRLWILACLAIPLAWPSSAESQSGALLGVMRTELDRSMQNLAHAREAPLYYLQYAVTEVHRYDLTAENGGLNAPTSSTNRNLDVDLRVGSMALDNTHEIRGGNWYDNYTDRRTVDFRVPVPEGPGAPDQGRGQPPGQGGGGRSLRRLLPGRRADVR
jgi:hypothetical protein